VPGSGHDGPVPDDWLDHWRDDWLDLALGGACVSCARPGRLLCATCAAAVPGEGRRVRPDPCPPGLAPAFATAGYADPVRRMILLHKERQVYGLATPLGRLLATAVGAGMVAAGRTVLVPVPSRRSVVRERGHDPMLRIARVAADALRAAGADVEVWPLLRQRDVVADQAGLGAGERAVNLADRIAVRTGRLRRLARSGVAVSAVVCDDVITTGATAREAQRALEDVGVPVAAICCVAATRRRVRLPK